VLVIVVATLGAVLLSRGSAKPGDAGAPVAATRVGICNIVTIHEESREWQERKEQFAKRLNDFSAELAARRKKIEDMKATIEELAPGSEEHERQLKSARHAAIKLTIWRQTTEADIQHDKFRTMQAMDKKALRVIAAVAQERGIDVVLPLHRLPEPRNHEELREVILRRGVLYHSAEVDLTKAVLGRLDAEYLAPKK
jgi:Skp family chaperone for outer membrane proteins